MSESKGPRPAAMVGAVLAAMLVMAGAGATAVETGGGSRGRAWPAAVRRLADFVERERGTSFDPVPVQFLGSETFEDAIAERSDPGEQARRIARDTTSELRALGLVDEEFDLVDANETIATGATAAYYDPTDKRIVVRGTRLTEDVRATLVHELTHVAQAHTGALDRTYDDDPRSMMALALVEGDATRIQGRWVAQLSQRESEQFQQESTEAVDRAAEATSDAAPFLTTSFQVPYSLGQAFTRVVVRVRGGDGLDGLLERAPRDDIGLLDPLAWDAGATSRKVSFPEPGRGRILDRSRVGAVGWFAILAQRLEPAQALDAADGWGGDAYVSWRRAGRTCARVAVRGRTPDDLGVLVEALDDWAAAGDGSAEVVARGELVTLTSCEQRGTATLVQAETASDALLLPTIRASVQAELLEADFTRAQARCVAQAVIDELPFATLRDDPQAVSRSAPALLRRCNVQPPS